MVAECMRFGLAPMSEEAFIAEDARLYGDLMQRRKANNGSSGCFRS